MKFKAAEIAQLLQGTVKGDANVEVSTLSKIEEGTAGAISFLANPKYEQYIYTTKASIVDPAPISTLSSIKTFPI